MSLIAEGEHEHQDFKYQISDARKIARSISAFANHSGGHLLVGVKDNGSIAGVKSDEEIYMVEQAAQMYCKPPQQVTFQLYNVGGKSILKADILEAENKPVKAIDDNGKWKTYFRVNDENILASALHVKTMREDKKTGKTDTALNYTEREQALLDYLNEQGGITLNGFARLAHCSRLTAEKSIVKLHDLGLVDIQYHDGQCLIVEKSIN